MPCNCEHMHPSKHEEESKRVMTLMKEVGLYNKEIPYYGEVKNIHAHTAILCSYCQNNDVTKNSLELQTWWRDHKLADEKKIKEKLRKKIQLKEKEAALSKLTDYEKELLGVKK